MPSNYPPGVSGNEPQITGEDDNYNMDEILLYLVCQDCGEAFQATTEGIMAAQAHEYTDEQDEAEKGCYGPSYMLQKEIEAM